MNEERYQNTLKVGRFSRGASPSSSETFSVGLVWTLRVTSFVANHVEVSTSVLLGNFSPSMER
jgi:hypothetical protein